MLRARVSLTAPASSHVSVHGAASAPVVLPGWRDGGMCHSNWPLAGTVSVSVRGSETGVSGPSLTPSSSGACSGW